MFSYVSIQDRIPAVHPLRATRQFVDLVATGVRSPGYNGERDAALGTLSGWGSERRWN